MQLRVHNPSRLQDYTRKASTPRLKRAWADVYSSARRRGFDESSAIAQASGIVRKMAKVTNAYGKPDRSDAELRRRYLKLMTQARASPPMKSAKKSSAIGNPHLALLGVASGLNPRGGKMSTKKRHTRKNVKRHVKRNVKRIRKTSATRRPRAKATNPRRKVVRRNRRRAAAPKVIYKTRRVFVKAKRHNKRRHVILKKARRINRRRNPEPFGKAFTTANMRQIAVVAAGGVVGSKVTGYLMDLVAGQIGTGTKLSTPVQVVLRLGIAAIVTGMAYKYNSNFGLGVAVGAVSNLTDQAVNLAIASARGTLGLSGYAQRAYRVETPGWQPALAAAPAGKLGAYGKSMMTTH